MVVQERQPTLGVARVLHALELFEIAGDRRLGDLEAELEQLAVNTWCSPAGILRLQPPNEQAMLCTDRPARWPRPPNPEQTEACTVPGDHCFWSDQNESIGPTRIPATQCDPEEPVETTEPRVRLLAFEHGELLAQGNDLQRQSVARQKECPQVPIIGTSQSIAPIIMRRIEIKKRQLTASVF